MKAKKIAVFGFDSAMIPLLDKHIAEGVMPNFERAFKMGTVCDRALVPLPTITPPNWTAIATGAWPGTNDITDFWMKDPGKTPNSINVHTCMDFDQCKAESIWEAGERAGKKSIILNWPASFNAHKKLKNGIVVGGAGLTVGTYMDEWVANSLGGNGSGSLLAQPQVISTQNHMSYPALKLEKAQGWKISTKADDLEATFNFNFSKSLYAKEIESYQLFILIEKNAQAYNKLSVFSSKNDTTPLFTYTDCTWSKKISTEIPLKNQKKLAIAFMAKLCSLNEKTGEFKIYMVAPITLDGNKWCYPPQIAQDQLNQVEAVPTYMGGYNSIMSKWIDEALWLEIIDIHNNWLANSAVTLMKNNDWDMFFMHSHPTDFTYHHLLTELDPATCSSKERYEEAWIFHREMYKKADLLLGKLLDAVNLEETIVVLISDHGSVADGAVFDPHIPLIKDSLTVLSDEETPLGKVRDFMPPNIRDMNAIFLHTADGKKSKALPQRMCSVYVNLKGRDPEGIVEPEDFAQVQREIIDSLLCFRDEKTGLRPVAFALRKEDAIMLGMRDSEQSPDVFYGLYPEFSAQHGPIIPTADYGIATLKTLLVLMGPNIKQNTRTDKVMNIIDVVPTACYLTGFPIPRDTEGRIIYQVLVDPDQRV